MRKKKTEVTICLFVTSVFRTNKCLHKYEKKEREREREHNTRAHHHSLDFLSSSSLICIKEIERKSG